MPLWEPGLLTLKSPDLQRQKESSHSVATGVMTSGAILLPFLGSQTAPYGVSDLTCCILQGGTPWFCNVSPKPALHSHLQGHSFPCSEAGCLWVTWCVNDQWVPWSWTGQSLSGFPVEQDFNPTLCCVGGSDTVSLLSASASPPRWKGANVVPSLQWPVTDRGSVLIPKAVFTCCGKWVSILLGSCVTLGLVLWGPKAL